MIEQAKLQVTIVVDNPVVDLNQPCLVELTLKNNSETAVRVNKRLSLGLKELDARELFAELHDAQTNYPARLKDVTIDQNFSPESDYIYLSPGNEITQVFDLFDIFKPQQPGEYILTLFYQADESLAFTPDDIVRGTYPSNSLNLTVQLGSPS